MADRAGLSASGGAHCSLDLPHSPGSRGSSPIRHDGERTDSQEALILEDQRKTNLLDWLKVEVRREFKGLIKEHSEDLAATQSRSNQKRVRKVSSQSPPRDPKKIRESYRHHSPLLDGFSSDSDNSDNSSIQEEGELSEEEEEKAQTSQRRLFPTELYSRMLPKILRALHISPKTKDEGEPDPDFPDGLETSLPQPKTDHRGIPMPAVFLNVLKTEWESPAKPKATNPLFHKLYTLVPPARKLVKLPTVDDPVNSLVSSSVLPMDADGLPKDQCDRRIELALRRNFEACTNAAKSAMTASLFTRAVYTWASDLASAEADLPKELKDDIKKMALASAFAADATLDSFQMANRGVASSVSARRNVWLRSWEADPSAQAKLAAVPFKGEELFGDTLDRYLVENKDKKKVLPSKRKEGKTRRRFRPFKDNRPSARHPYLKSQRSRWQTKSKEESRGAGFTKPSQTHKPNPKKSV